MEGELTTALIGLASSIVIASVTYLFSKKNQRDLDTRKWKEQIYNQFWTGFTKATLPKATSDEAMEYAHAHNQLLLIADSKTVKAAMDVFNYIKAKNGSVEINDKSDVTQEKHITNQHLSEADGSYIKDYNALVNLQLQQNLYEAMRRDLFGKKANDGFPFICAANLSMEQIIQKDANALFIKDAIDKAKNQKTQLLAHSYPPKQRK